MTALLLVVLLAQPDLDAALSAAVKRAAERAAPSVVRLDRVGGDAGSAALTGVAINGDGRIVTSAHAFEKTSAGVVVTFPDGARTPAAIVGLDKVLHLAHLKVDRKTTPITPTPLDGVRVGGYALAVGCGLTETPTVSLGVVSALNRVLGKAIQSDAKISPTNYGGPLLDLQGRAMGVIVPLSPDEGQAGTDLYDSGIGFAIPITDVVRSVERSKKGTMNPGLLGLAWRQKKPLDGPLAVEQIAWKSPAAEAGLSASDLIKAVNGKPIAFYSQFRTALGRLYAGDAVRIDVERGGKAITATVRAVAKLPVYRPPFLGLRLEEKESRLVIRQVEPPASSVGLQADDVVLELDGPVRSLGDVAARLRVKSADDAFALAIERGGKREVKAIRGDAWPVSLPIAPPVAPGKATLTDSPPPMEHWLLKPSSKPQALVVAGRAKADQWKAACENFGVAILGVEPGIETPLLASLVSTYQKLMGLDARRTAVFAAGPEAELLAKLLGPLVEAVAADGGPIAPPTPQPDDARRYLVLERAGGGSVVEAVKKAREEGVPIVEHTVTDPKPDAVAEAVARWAAGLGRF